jgi:hypothetical protein
MTFNKRATALDQIQLLQRSILVNSYAYYELNENILTDFQYDANALQLAKLKEEYPEEFRRSCYHDYFYDFCSDGSARYTSGFDLIERVRKKDAELYRYVRIDANVALDMKRKHEEMRFA